MSQVNIRDFFQTNIKNGIFVGDQFEGSILSIYPAQIKARSLEGVKYFRSEYAYDSRNFPSWNRVWNYERAI